MAILIANKNLLTRSAENKIIKKWNYNFTAIDNTEFTKYITCVYNQRKKIENYDLENEYEYTSFITQNKNFSLEMESNSVLYDLKYNEWINKYFIPMTCISEFRDLKLGVDHVRFLNGSMFIIPHVVCPHLLDNKIDELSLVHFKQSFCEKHSLL
jgi:hypothetical protein